MSSGGLPAARFGDMHFCPSTKPAIPGEPEKPHVGGVVFGPCASKVFIEGVRAARLADFAFCTGAGVFDIAVQGAATVLIEELPALRMTDRMLHGGAVGLGASRTRIGGPTFEVPPNVSIVGPSDYQNRVVRDLFLFSKTPNGKDWLRRLAATGEPVQIVDNDGTGTNATMDQNGPGITIVYDSTTTDTYFNGAGGYPMPAEPQSALAHEIVHATRMAEGRDDSSERTAEAEEQTATNEEGKIREQWGLPVRERHTQGYKGPWKGEPSPLKRPGRY